MYRVGKEEAEAFTRALLSRDFFKINGSGREVYNFEEEWKQMTETEEQKADAARGDRVKQAKEHWLEFDDVPMNPETECIEAPFLHFPAGTHREEIWNWFEEYYRVPVYDLLYDFDNVK